MNVDYAYGFSSDIGAGPYDRRGQAIAAPAMGPGAVVVTGGGSAIGAQAGAGTITIGDCATYAAAPVTITGDLMIAAANGARPLIRLVEGQTWVIRSTSADARLRLDGLFVSGGTVMLAGSFAEVVITCSTLDPGDATRLAADGRALVPTQVIVTGTVTALTIDRTIVGPVCARDYDPAIDPPEAAPAAGFTGPAAIETVTISNSIVQALRAPPPESPPQSPPISPPASPPIFPGLIPAALSFADGTLALSRCTVLGRIEAHRLTASECLLTETVVVDDRQDGCIRYSALVASGQPPRTYACVLVAAGAPIFTSTRFGDAGYAQLREDADRQCRPLATELAVQATSIRAGSADGSEMGAFARDLNPIRARALAVKLQEYMPAAMTPVVFNLT
jgi:hypothetical protein